MWVFFALASALLLGVYDVFKKKSLAGNAVIPVLAGSVFFSSLMFVPCLILSAVNPDLAKDYYVYVPETTGHEKFVIFIKAAIVLSSWMCGYFAMKHLPMTIFTPIRATQPVWTVIGALLIFGEKLSLVQVVGISVTIFFFFMFSTAGKKEGISWRNNVWVWLIIAATLIGAASGLYDKYLMRSYDRMAVQVYSTFFQSLLMALVLVLVWWRSRKKKTPFVWRWSIIGISLFLVFADYVYYWALSDKDSLISVVSTIRRSGAVVGFLYGAFFLKEGNLKQKGLYLAGVLLGVSLLVFH